MNNKPSNPAEQTEQDDAPRISWFGHNEFEINGIANIAHDMNKALCMAYGDHSQPEWEDAPQWQRNSAINGVKHHLITLENGEELTPGDSHKSWLAEKENDGWVYGPVKNPDIKEHPCMVDFNQLPPEQQAKDYLFIQVVKSFVA